MGSSAHPSPQPRRHLGQFGHFRILAAACRFAANQAIEQRHVR